MVLLLWFYLSGVVFLLGAELNAEIEHASPYGKAVGEKVPGREAGDRRARLSAIPEAPRARGRAPLPGTGAPDGPAAGPRHRALPRAVRATPG